MKRLYFTAMMMLMSMCMMADQLTPEEAIQRLSGSTQNVARKVMRAKAAGQLQLAYTSTVDGMNSYYAFNNTQGGFVLLSADDCLPAVLGTVDGSSFDYENLPSNMKWFLSIYDRAVKNFSRAGVKMNTISKDDVDPLLENSWLGNIQWGQGEPFFNQTPSYGNEKHLVTGCVATAMAQVMAYHKWPDHGVGEYTHTFNVEVKKDSFDKKTTTVYANFQNTYYDWDNLLPKYKGVTYNADQANAVATLMFHCGVAARMGYGTSAAGGSGASSTNAARGLVDYFRYSKGIQVLRHYAYTNDEWDEAIYEEVSNGRPVIFGGNNSEGKEGHEFVCDGFRDGLFHINWGWNGSDNHYFYLTGDKLNSDIYTDPDATDNIFGYDLMAIVGIEPDKDGTSEFSYSKMSTSTYVIDVKKNTSILTLTGDFYNTYYRDLKVYPGVSLISENDTLYYLADSTFTIETDGYLLDNESYNMYSVNVPVATMEPGTYTVLPAYSEDGENCTMMIAYQDYDLPQIEVDDNHKMIYVDAALANVKKGAKMHVLNDQKEFHATTKDPDCEPEVLKLIIDGGITNNSTDYTIIAGVRFENSVSERRFNTYNDLYNTIGSEETEDTLYIDIPADLDVDSTYYVFPIVWPAVLSDVNKEFYADEIDRMAEYAINKYENVPMIKIIKRETTDITDVTEDADKSKPTKFVRDGRIFIRRNDDIFTTSGQRVR